MTTFIIAEVGINHNGNIKIAKDLIEVAKEAGCDAVKFQKRTVDAVYSKEFLDSPRESPWGKTQRDQKMGLEFSEEEYDLIDEHCSKLGIPWFASAWDIKSQKFLRKYNLKYNKIASPLLTNLNLLKVVAKEKKPTFISTGMCNYSDVVEAVLLFNRFHCPYTLMHCISTYPCEYIDCNLRVIQSFKERFSCDVGYSGHEQGTFPTLLAVAVGAAAIERHITLSKIMYGSDQEVSLNPYELRLMVNKIRETEQILGDGVKKFSDKEKKIAEKLR